MADNTNKVTIDADYFAELYLTAKECVRSKHDCVECAVVKERDGLKKELDEHLKNCRDRNCWLNAEYKALTKERDELKAKLDCADVDRETYKDRAEAAEQCIEDVWNCLSPQEIADNEYAHIDIIRAYREKKEAR